VSFHVVIPARYGSTRLPGKPLLDIGGKPMVQHVVVRACASAAASVTVATDDARVARAVSDPREPGRDIAVLTDPALPSGTDRAAVVAGLRGWPDDTIVVNVQGDEPFVSPALIDQVAALLRQRPGAAIATLVTPMTSVEHWLDPNVVKVVVDADGYALYFSRAPIPWDRDAMATRATVPHACPGALRHVGMYAYRVSALRTLTRWTTTALERIERLEQLRALEHGMRIAVGVCVEVPAPGVDTENDLAAARARVRDTTAGV
jgi:3-deoxy-manno-octulosonate cytidylyltransferase (CMP-KDO synthetase)